MKYKAGLIVSGCWQDTNRERLYDELSWESMSDRLWFRRLTLFYKISNGLAPSYLADQVPVRSENNINLRSRHSIPSTTEWYIIIGISNRFGIKLFTKIRVGFSDLRAHRFNHNINCESLSCICNSDEETSVRFFLCCPRYNIHMLALLSKISDIIGCDVSVLPSDHLCNILVYGSNLFNSISNELIIHETIHYIGTTGRFTNPEAF